MRYDSIGLFWKDEPPPKKEAVVKEKKEPPNPVWLHPDFVPKFDPIPMCLMSDAELATHDRSDVFMLDIECYPNYFLVLLTSYKTGKVVYEDMAGGGSIDYSRLRWILNTFGIVTFNGNSYDIPMLTIAMQRMLSCAELKDVSNTIIGQKLRSFQILKQYKAKKIEVNHVDLIELAPLKANLKIYGGRLHIQRMQDLPFHHENPLNPIQINIVRQYCYNDTVNTAFLYANLQEEIDVRIALSNEYGVDLRSKSDAQIAETVISKEVAKLNGDRIRPPEIDAGTRFKFKAAQTIKFQTPLMNDALRIIEAADYVVKEDGGIDLPREVKALKLAIDDNVYRMGIGGLHSSETKVVLKSSKLFKLRDHDVVSYYPSIILNLGMYPAHLGRAFLKVYRTLVEKRISAKAAKRKTEAATLKITINGTFGKLMNKYSDVYAPLLGITVTLSGQLYLLMLIERMVLAGIRVVSANTDGIVIYCPTDKEHIANGIIAQWEKETKFETEETLYDAIYIRDVNNYMAVKPDGKIKEKGAYANPWKDNSTLEMLKKNPTNTICIEAIQKFLTEARSIEQTIRECTDVSKFITVRGVSGGAVKNGEYLGKAIRWYYAQGETGEIVTAKKGHTVPRSEGAKPLMEMTTLPNDIDYDWYIREAHDMLSDFNNV